MTESAPTVRDLVEFLARSLVEEPDRVEVIESDQDGDILLEVRVGPEDLGRVIGRGGRLANAIRIVTRAAASRSDQRAYVEIIEQ